jgi:hypothetical protein
VRAVVIATSFVALAMLGGACRKGKPTTQTAPDNVTSGSSEDLKGDKGHLTKVHGFAPDISVPKGTGAPPVKTDGPIDPVKLKALGEQQFAGFKREIKTDEPGKLVVVHTTGSRPTLRATVTIEPCGPSTECRPMDLAAWQAKSDDLKKATIRADLLPLPDTSFEIGSNVLNGTNLVYTYAVGFLPKTDENGNPAGSYQDAYELYYNDGHNRISVIAEYWDDQPQSIKALQGYAPKGDLEKIAIGFLDLFTQNW